MGSRLSLGWLGIRNSMWFVPAVLTAGAALLATGTIELDSRLSRDMTRVASFLAFGGGVEGARGVLTAIASTTITVTGVVFSLTVVALQLASSQFSPRALRSFSRDRVTQVAMGSFIGTFTYALLVLRTVRSSQDDGASFVPSVSVGVAIVLMLGSIGLLIYYIHHIAQSIQASPTIDRVARDANATIQRLFPDPVGEPAPVTTPDFDVGKRGAPGFVRAEGAGYLQAVDADALFALADRGRLTVRMELMVGEFALAGSVLAAVWPLEAAEREDVAVAVRRAFMIGPHRTLEHDAAFGIRQLADIGIKALSPGINDPTTALTSIDRLAEVLVNLGRRCPPDPIRRGADGEVRFIARELSFAQGVEIAFAQLRHYGSEDAHVLAHLILTLGRIGAQTPGHLRGALENEIGAAREAGRQGERLRDENALLDRAAAEASALLMVPWMPTFPDGGTNEVRVRAPA